MTTPITPTTSPTTPPIPTQTPDPAPTDSQIAALAAQLSEPQIPFDPTNLRKGVITASNPTTAPPNVSLTLSGSPTVIDGVRYIDSYSPVVGDTVLVAKQGTDIFVLGQMNDSGSGTANGWQTSGGVSYRLVLDRGDLKVQFKGSFAASGTTLFTLPAGYRPSVTRTLVCGRDGNATSVLLQIDTGGVITVRNGTVTVGTDSVAPGGTTGAVAPGGTTDTAAAGATGGFLIAGPTDSVMHSHGGAISPTTINHNFTDDVSHTHSTPTHSHTLTTSSHTHTLTTTSHTHTQTLATPATVYFDGLEMFL